ncbi:succinylglutamate desuccinylase/aspartoacylase family protein [Patescibacteria group bacterium]|nr:succinylglutamate desuccinylase/aspartoacylase family protein [Patescibacteria group bacterium]
MHVNLEASKQKKRYINHNMNRIRNQDFQENSYEHQRKNELLPLLDTLDILFDIHSTSKPSPCICITDEQFLTKAK